MRRRRRYEVVVEGLSGQAAAQRSVISDHRTEEEARENARLERARLEVIHGDGARAWRIVVVRDDEVLAEEIPHSGREPRRRAAERAPRAQPALEEAAVAPAEAPAPARPPVEEDPPEDRASSGPVPGWLIAQVEESIARQRERTYGRPADEDGDEDERPGPR